MAKMGSGPRRPNQERRNERERKRVNLVNDGFDLLRNRVPKSVVNKKLSKADTLREAAKYIEHLVSLLGQNSFEQAACMSTSPCSSSSSFNQQTQVDYSMYRYPVKQEPMNYSMTCSPPQMAQQQYYYGVHPYSQ